MNQSYSSEGLYQNTRSKFVSKVYSLLSLQLAVTVLFVVANMHFAAFARFQQTSRFFYVLAIIGTIGPMLALGIPLLT